MKIEKAKHIPLKSHFGNIKNSGENFDSRIKGRHCARCFTPLEDDYQPELKKPFCVFCKNIRRKDNKNRWHKRKRLAEIEKEIEEKIHNQIDTWKEQ